MVIHPGAADDSDEAQKSQQRIGELRDAKCVHHEIVTKHAKGGADQSTNQHESNDRIVLFHLESLSDFMYIAFGVLPQAEVGDADIAVCLL